MTQNVLVFAATGRTGGVIANSLLEAPQKFNVFLAVRPESSGKPIVKEFEAKGATIVLLDFAKPKREELLTAMTGKDVVISAIYFEALDSQILLADVAKEAGVKRFVPCDFGTPCVKGVRPLYDQKLRIHDHIESIGLGYTYIDVGWWFQNNFPLRKPEPNATWLVLFESSRLLFEGDKRSIHLDMRDIGPFVARIIDDARTLNRYVIIWGEEVTQRQIHSLYHRFTGEELEVTHVSEGELRERIAKNQGILSVFWDYMYSLWIRGDNTVENSKKPEYGSALDARELYPDVPVRTLEDYAKEVLVETNA